MAKIVFHKEFEIDKCDKCPMHYTKPVYTGDSFDHGEDYYCGVNKELICGFVEWRSELCEVPDWCPFREDKEENKKMPVNDELGKRMKEYYENISKTKLMRRCPVAIRIDGKAFHTYTKGFARPFDKLLMKTMQETMKCLCENIQGCVFGYTQSDEITLILTDYKKLTSSAWFDYKVQKLCSISASIATNAFGKIFRKNVYEHCKGKISDSEFLNAMIYGEIPSELDSLSQKYLRSLHRGAELDSRCFNIPKEEVANLINWRQIDATRNSIQMVGQSIFSHKELHKKNQNMIQDMLHEKGINWNDYPIDCKRGAACYKVERFVENPKGNMIQFDGENRINGTMRSEWVIDREMPIIKGEDRAYVENLIYYKEEE